jgi:hypothetical protein
VSYSQSVVATAETYETGFTGRRLTLSGSVLPSTPLVFTYAKLFPNQLFSDHPFRTMLYELNGTTFANRIFSYKEVPPSFKEYRFYYEATTRIYTPTLLDD